MPSKVGGSDFYEVYVPEAPAFESVFSSWDRDRFTPKEPFWEPIEKVTAERIAVSRERRKSHTEMRARLEAGMKIPTLAEAKSKLPEPSWAGHESAIACYWKVWEIAFGNIRRRTPENGFVSDFAATMFNDCTFLWDSAFITLFGRYAANAWNFQQTLDNFYGKQHPDGFICREIRERDGSDCFGRFDAYSTGPNVLPWVEWEYYLNRGDRVRLAAVFGPLVAYARWLRRYHTWPNGLYWSTGWGCGMDDDQPRLPPDVHHSYDHGGQTWVDACFQAAMGARLIGKMARELQREDEVADFAAELAHLSELTNRLLWDEESAFYHDLRRDQSRATDVQTIGAFWALLADTVPPERLAPFLAHLENPSEFNRAHRVPTLSADHPKYDRTGGYWKGAVWAPTNYMLLRGLTQVGHDTLAHEMGENHLDNVVLGFEKTGTLWENYAPDVPGQGNNNKDFVGWTGVPPVAVLFEYVFGLRPDVPQQRLVWDVRILEAHGVRRYPFGASGLVDLMCGPRNAKSEKPALEIRSSIGFELDLRWEGGRELRRIEPV